MDLDTIDQKLLLTVVLKEPHPFDLTVEEGLKQLSTLCSMQMVVKNGPSCLKIPRPREQSRQLLKALDIRMPTVLPHREVRVVTRKKLTERRKQY